MSWEYWLFRGQDICSCRYNYFTNIGPRRSNPSMINVAASTRAADTSFSEAPVLANLRGLSARNTHFNSNFQTSALRRKALLLSRDSHPCSRSSPSWSISLEHTRSKKVVFYICITIEEWFSDLPSSLQTNPKVPRIIEMSLSTYKYNDSSTHISSSGPPVSGSI